MQNRIVIVQDADTKLFLNSEKGWTPSVTDARDFRESVSAVTFCLQHGLQRVQVVMKFNTGRSDVVIPVAPEDGSVGAQSEPST